jgi:hypothetical protein
MSIFQPENALHPDFFEFSRGRMPSRPANVHRTQQGLGQYDHAKTGDFASTGPAAPDFHEMLRT